MAGSNVPLVNQLVNEIDQRQNRRPLQHQQYEVPMSPRTNYLKSQKRKMHEMLRKQREIEAEQAASLGSVFDSAFEKLDQSGSTPPNRSNSSQTSSHSQWNPILPHFSDSPSLHFPNMNDLPPPSQSMINKMKNSTPNSTPLSPGTFGSPTSSISTGNSGHHGSLNSLGSDFISITDSSNFSRNQDQLNNAVLSQQPPNSNDDTTYLEVNTFPGAFPVQFDELPLDRSAPAGLSYWPGTVPAMKIKAKDRSIFEPVAISELENLVSNEDLEYIRRLNNSGLASPESTPPRKKKFLFGLKKSKKVKSPKPPKGSKPPKESKPAKPVKSPKSSNKNSPELKPPKEKKSKKHEGKIKKSNKKEAEKTVNFDEQVKAKKKTLNVRLKAFFHPKKKSQ